MRVARVVGCAEQTAGFAADEFGEVGVLLLRHRAGAGGEGFGEIEEAELGGGVERELLGEARDVDAEGGDGLRELEGEVAVAGRVHAVGRGGVEVEGAGGDGAVEGEGCACDGSGAERAEVHALAGVGEAGGVALDHADVGEEPVGYEDGLGALEVGVGGHDGFACGFGEVDEGFAPCGEASEGVVDGFADEEAHVSGDLLVAAAAGVELEGEVADLFGEFEFDEVMDVFGLFVGGDALSSFATARRPCFHLEEFFAGEDSGGFDGAGVGYAGLDFVGEQAPVEGEGALPVIRSVWSSGSRKRPDHIFVDFVLTFYLPV